MEISIESKREIFSLLIQSNTDFIGENHNRFSNNDFEFIKSIWDIFNMPSEDPRFPNAAGDIWQHVINNDDWDLEYLFTERLKLYDSNELFIQFTETVLSPIYRENEDEIIHYVLQINNILRKDNLQLSIFDYNAEGIPIYKVFNIEDVENIPIDIKKNSIIFFVQSQNEDIDLLTSPYKEYFLLREYKWDDYNSKTSFYLYYIKNASKSIIGEIKIMTKEHQETLDVLPKSFYSLTSNFCSLGQKDIYYENLRALFPANFEDILFAIADCAFFTEKLEDFDEHHRFKNSLIRYDYAERTLRLIKYKLNDYDLKNLFAFDYKFTPKYSKQFVNINFNFSADNLLSNRIYAIIGKNGTGKTQLLNSLPINISENKSDYFIPRVPMFSKLITVSYSIFDRFKIPRKTTKFNYLYCGLKNEKGEFITERGLVLRFHNTWKKIESKQRINKWRTILSNFIESEILDEFLIKRETITSYNNLYKVDIEGFNRIKDRLSSGQNILLYIITEITANIRLDSLILYDEPETHLHPNAISQLINTIYELVDEFQSYCIIGTHSPLIIQELLSKNVYVIERNGNNPDVRRIGIESFGENLTTLTEDVFGTREIPKQYKKIIDEQVDLGKSFDEIVSLLQFDKMPLSLNTRLYIKSKTLNFEKFK
ncbi:AAA family ATPase [Flavobacterium sp. I-STPA6A]|uniref:AbiJ-related protein n=1 Tax=Flavobacterium sp. I-STPA6A TaxID=2590450 RepID=UPI00131C40D3|nr:AAA family ATPase [Flavobacterium sp. I-STPA6A]